jgi:hypothetical protein
VACPRCPSGAVDHGRRTSLPVAARRKREHRATSPNSCYAPRLVGDQSASERGVRAPRGLGCSRIQIENRPSQQRLRWPAQRTRTTRLVAGAQTAARARERGTLAPSDDRAVAKAVAPLSAPGGRKRSCDSPAAGYARLSGIMLAGALLIRPTRQRARLVTAAVLVIVGLAMAGTIIGGRGTDSPARASHPKVRLAAQSLPLNPIPYGSCFVATGSSCSLTPCTEFIGRSSAEDAVAHSSVPATQRRPRLTGTRCAAYPHARPQDLVVVARAVKPTRPRR